MTYENNEIEDYLEESELSDSYQKNVDYVEENLWQKVERLGKKFSFTKDILALYNYFRDSEVTWYRKSIVLGALVYFIVPIDSIPDLTPLIGYLDDLGVITAVLKYLGSELIPYYDRRF